MRAPFVPLGRKSDEESGPTTGSGGEGKRRKSAFRTSKHWLAGHTTKKSKLPSASQRQNSTAAVRASRSVCCRASFMYIHSLCHPMARPQRSSLPQAIDMQAVCCGREEAQRAKQVIILGKHQVIHTVRPRLSSARPCLFPREDNDRCVPGHVVRGLERCIPCSYLTL